MVLFRPKTSPDIYFVLACGIAEKNVTLGVPRIRELIDASKSIKGPCTTIHLKDAVAENRQFCKVYAARLPQFKLEEAVSRSEVIPVSKSCGPEDDFVMSFPSTLPEASSWVIRMVLDKDALRKRDLNIENVRDTVQQYLDNLQCQCELRVAQMNMTEWFLRVRMGGLEEMRSNLEEKVQEGQNVVSEFEKNMCHLFSEHLGENVILCGLEGIAECVYDEEKRAYWDEKKMCVQSQDGHVLFASGLNLRELWDDPLVNWQRTYSNDLHEVQGVLGIEAARCLLFNEIRNVLSFDGSYVNDRHIWMVCNAMTRDGSLNGLTRHGMAKMKVSPLTKCTFERTTETILEAAFYGENNPLTGVSDNIMFGQRVPLGTGKPVLMLDPHACPAASRRTLEELHLTRTYACDAWTLGPPKRYRGLSPTLDTWDGSKSPEYVPTSPVGQSPVYNPTSPTYNPTSPVYNPSSPTYNPTSPAYNPRSPVYNPSSPTYNPSSPTYNPTSPAYNPSSPTYNPTSPAYNPSSPTYNPTSPAYNPSSPTYNASSPTYNPSSPPISRKRPLPESPLSSSKRQRVGEAEEVEEEYDPENPWIVQEDADEEYDPSNPGYTPLDTKHFESRFYTQMLEDTCKDQDAHHQSIPELPQDVESALEAFMSAFVQPYAQISDLAMQNDIGQSSGQFVPLTPRLRIDVSFIPSSPNLSML